MMNLLNRLTPMQHGIVSLVFGFVLLGYLLHIFEGFFFFILLALALVMIAQGVVQSGLYATIMTMIQKQRKS